MKDKYRTMFGKLIPLIGIVLFIFLLWSIGPEEIYNAFKMIKLEYFIFASILIAPRFFLIAYKWYFICQKQKIGVNYFYVLKILFVNYIYAMTTPGSIGFHLRIFYIKKKSNESFEKCFANSIVDITLHVISMAFLASIGSILIINILGGDLSIIPPIIFSYLVFMLIVFAVFIKKKTGNKIGRIFIRFIIPKKYRDKFEETLEKFYEDIPLIKDLWFPFILDNIAWLIASFQVYLIAISFNSNIGFDSILWIHMISMTFTMILPISVGGLGVREGVFVTILKRIGIAGSTGMAISLGGFVVKTVIPSFIGVIISIFNRNKKGEKNI